MIKDKEGFEAYIQALRDAVYQDAHVLADRVEAVVRAIQTDGHLSLPLSGSPGFANQLSRVYGTDLAKPSVTIVASAMPDDGYTVMFAGGAGEVLGAQTPEAAVRCVHHLLRGVK